MENYAMNLDDYLNEQELEQEELDDMSASEQFYMEGMLAEELPSEQFKRIDNDRWR